jgi:hypothetical protein
MRRFKGQEMRELRKALLHAIGNRIREFGFEPNPAKQSFKRQFPGGDFDIAADVAVRFNALEEMVNRYEGFISEREKKQTCSLGAELGNIAGTGQMRWRMAIVGDLDSAATGIVEAFEKIGVPYLQSASTMQSAYELLSSPGKAWLHNPLPLARAKRVVALAKLLGKDEDVPLRIAENMALLESDRTKGSAEFRRFLLQMA